MKRQYEASDPAANVKELDLATTTFLSITMQNERSILLPLTREKHN